VAKPFRDCGFCISCFPSFNAGRCDETIHLCGTGGFCVPKVRATPCGTPVDGFYKNTSSTPCACGSGPQCTPGQICVGARCVSTCLAQAGTKLDASCWCGTTECYQNYECHPGDEDPDPDQCIAPEVDEDTEDEDTDPVIA
jgi:hypothetical protein